MSIKKINSHVIDIETKLGLGINVADFLNNRSAGKSHSTPSRFTEDSEYMAGANAEDEAEGSERE